MASIIDLCFKLELAVSISESSKRDGVDGTKLESLDDVSSRGQIAYARVIDDVNLEVNDEVSLICCGDRQAEVICSFKQSI